MVIKIPLRVASKKNNRRNFRNISLPSLAYVNFHKLVAKHLTPHNGLRFTKPFQIDVKYQIKGKYHQDIDNVVSSVLDCLTDYKIIEDDELCVKVTASKTQGHKDWMCIVKIDSLVKPLP